MLGSSSAESCLPTQTLSRGPGAQHHASIDASIDLIDHCIDGRFQLRELIGEGAYGRVYRAEQRPDGEAVAVKILNPELASAAEYVECFLREAVTASMLRSDHTVHILDYGHTADGLCFIAMELLSGCTLTRLITGGTRLELDRSLGIMLQILRGLERIHAAGIVHADIKGDNIVVDGRPGGDQVKIIDFGIARQPRDDGELLAGAPSSREMHLSAVCGTPGYMAPEVICGRQPSTSCDIYAAGVVLYQLLTGRMPYTGRTPVEVFKRQLADPLTLPSQLDPHLVVPGELEAVLLRAIARDPAERYPTIAAFRRALRQVRGLIARRSGAPATDAARPTRWDRTR